MTKSSIVEGDYSKYYRIADHVFTIFYKKWMANGVQSYLNAQIRFILTMRV